MKGDENDTPVGLKTTSKPVSRASGWQIAHGREKLVAIVSRGKQRQRKPGSGFSRRDSPHASYILRFDRPEGFLDSESMRSNF